MTAPTHEQVLQAQMELLKKRLEAMSLLTQVLTKTYVTDTHKSEVLGLIDEISHTKGGKYYD